VLLGGGAARLLDAAGAAAAGSAGPAAVHAFVSRPDLRPPRVTVERGGGSTAPGLVFVAPSSGPGQRGAMILDDAGDVVWFHPTTPNTAMNFRPGLYRGQPVLTWWEGKTEHGLGRGTHVVLDASYRVVARFPAGDHRQSDLHELLLTPRGTAYVTSYEYVPADLSSIGGARRARVIDGIVQELEIPSARVLWEWRSLDHVTVGESHGKPGNPYDYFHVNSIDVAPNGDLIVSARNTWAVYRISRKTGGVLWRLGGRRTDFRMGPGTVFAWQHDARLHDGGTLVSIFDDGAAPQVQPQSKVLVLGLDHVRRRAALVHKYVHAPERLVAKFMGNAQILPNGNVFVGWGSEPYFSEFSADGAIQFDARLPHGGENYRAFRFPWVGRPSLPPALVRSPSDGSLHASWNGATEVASWQLRVGTDAGALQPALTVPKQGFETRIDAQAGGGYADVVALDATGAPLGSSGPVSL
jgi:Arylsulfotransferase (ASST)